MFSTDDRPNKTRSAERFPSRRFGILTILLIAFALLAFAPSGGESSSGTTSSIGIDRAAASHDRTLSFEDRVGYQRRIEEVYWRNRIWPAENPGPKPPLSEVLPEAAIRERVTTYLEKSAALEHFWSRPVTGEQLQAEMERMARQTKNPELLAELFAALDDDPFLIAECLARPVLVDRLTRNWYARDTRFHGELKRQAEEALAAYPDDAVWMPDLGGEYNETEWRLVAEDSETVEQEPENAEHVVIDLTAEEWEEQVGRLAAAFGVESEPGLTGDEAEPLREIPLHRISRLTEENEAFVVTAVLSVEADRMRTATVHWAKRTFDAWWEEEARTAVDVIGSGAFDLVSEPAGGYEPVSPRNGGCTDDTWTEMSYVPTGRFYHTAVWTGSEMIVWGGEGGGSLNSGGQYDPATDSWTATSTGDNVPSGRYNHTAVWTGSEMIVWGGDGGAHLNTGGRYDPSTDSWTATSTGDNVPSGRKVHTAVWTGSEMIVWGGYDGAGLNSGGRYDPSTDSWAVTSTGANVPSARYSQTVVWTGSKMIVWGGYDGAYLNSGGRYDPSLDSWAATSTGDNVPAGRRFHTAVWTGSKMIVWGGHGGVSLNSGGRYDPVANSWTATSTGANVPTARYAHTAVWTGTEMIVWGGNGFKNSGGWYDPVADSWTATSTGANVPAGKYNHTAVWTGSEMIVWGGYGYLNTGGRYDPIANSWTATSTGANVPSARNLHTAVWTGSEMIVWGGYDGGYLNSGGRYDPATDNWSATSTETGVPSGRRYHTAVWTGTQMIVWGGNDGNARNSGGRYDPTADSWSATSMGANVPSARMDHIAVWTGPEMIVWGGYAGGQLNSGGRYDPATDSWNATSTGGDVPSGRRWHTVVWTGSEMIVWGGYDGGQLNSGGRYNPVTDNWSATPSGPGVPSGRRDHTAVWTGSTMIIWGGNSSANENSGGRYDPTTDIWSATSMGVNVPSARLDHTAVWTGTEMIVWGGSDGGYLNTGGRYDPAMDNWSATSTGVSVPSGRRFHTAVWTGTEMIVWAGYDPSYLNTGGLYCAAQLQTWYLDADGDGHGDTSSSTQSATQPPGYVASSDDCDDTDPNVWTSCGACVDVDTDTYYVGCDAYTTVLGPDCDDTKQHCTTDCTDVDADDYCVGHDCDDSVGTCTTDCTTDVDSDATYDCADTCLDADGDGYGDPGGAGNTCTGVDCDDTDAERFPGNPEYCDGKDNDCNGTDDDGLVFTEYYYDDDGDGHGAHGLFVSCQDIMAAGLSEGDGFYWINSLDPGSPVGPDAYLAYCDMSADGGGWTLVYDQDVSVAPGYRPKTEWDSVNPDSPHSGQYSILDRLDTFRNEDDTLELMLTWSDGPSGHVHWTQANNPLTGDGSPGAFSIISMDPATQSGCGAFSGLKLGTEQALLDCTPFNCWWWAVGTQVEYCNPTCGIPRFEGSEPPANRAMLWVRSDHMNVGPVTTCDGPPSGMVANGNDCDDSKPHCTIDCIDIDGDDYCVEHDCDDAVGTCTTDCATDTDGDAVYDCADTCIDVDGDGYGTAGGAGDTCTGIDCDDTNPNCTADCTDIDGDDYCVGHDCDDAVGTCTTDCATDTDGDAVYDCADTCIDADGDGYGTAGGAGDTCTGIDCDDTNPNCTADCTDVDGDDYCVGHDCDDGDGTVYPGAAQICDGLNNDCDHPLWPETSGSAWTTSLIYNEPILNPRTVYVVDIDDDSDMDAVSLGYNSQVNWYENTAGDGSAWTPLNISNSADDGGDLVMADVDGDGDPDAVFVSDEMYTVYWSENKNGDGSVWDEHIISYATGGKAVFAADMDNDGDIDTLSPYHDGVNGYYAIAWHENTAGDGTAWFDHPIPMSAGGRDYVFAADIDGDGDMDVIAGSEKIIYWYENTSGDGTAFTERLLWDYTAAPGTTRTVFATDIDGDGDIDVLANFTTGVSIDELFWYDNTAGNGTVWAEGQVSTVVNNVWGIFAADVDGDGDMDVLSASRGTGKIMWHENTAGDGSLWYSQPISDLANGARSVFAADLDGDGDMDALSGAATNGVEWHEHHLGTNESDDDGDGLSECDGDCNDHDLNNWTSCATCLDTDSDSWFVGCDTYNTIDGPDNCPSESNPDQLDSDTQDGGDVCDICPMDPTDLCNAGQSGGEDVDAGGGQVESADGTIVIDIPAGALPENTSISITESSASVPPGNGDVVLAVTLGPEGQTFAQPVTLALEWPDIDGDDLVDGMDPPVLEVDLRVWKDGVLFAGPCGSTPGCDTVTNTWALQLSGFSQFALLGSVCGDGTVDAGEECDDSGTATGDGCSDTCTVEAGYECTGEPSTCTLLCGNGSLDAGEACDDGNTAGGDCCSADCQTTAPNGTSCDDGDACTTGETCQGDTGGTCSNGSAVTCNDDDECTADSCVPATGCSNTAISCDDSDACTTDTCAPAIGCEYATVVCDDSDACTGTESCDPASGCVAGTPLDCNDGNACTTDSCDPATGCSNTAINCDDSRQCTDDGCDPATGCVFTLDETNTCNDGDACTENDHCGVGTIRSVVGTDTDPLFPDGPCPLETSLTAVHGAPSDWPGFTSSMVSWTHDYAPLLASILSATLTIDLGDADSGELDVQTSSGTSIGTIVGGDNGMPGPFVCPWEWDGQPEGNDIELTIPPSLYADLADGSFDLETLQITSVGGYGINRAILIIELDLTCVADTVDCSDDDLCNGTETCDPAIGCGPPTGPLDCNDSNDCTSDLCDAGTGCYYEASGMCSIAGTVNYYRDFDADVEPSTKPVPDVDIDIDDDSVLDGTTDGSGDYAVNGLFGTFTVTTLDKLDAPNTAAVGSNDAAWIAQFGVLLRTFSENQQVAADVSGNGHVGALDASLVARYAVGLILEFPVATATGSDWVFYRCDTYNDETDQDCGTPVYLHDPLSTIVTDDFYALFYGDTTGNWAPGGGFSPLNSDEGRAAELDRQTAQQLKSLGSLPQITRGSEAAVLTLRTESGRARPGTQWTVLVNLENAEGIHAIDLDFGYDPEKVSILGIENTEAGSGMSTVSNDLGGEARVGMYGVLPMQQSGTILAITLEARKSVLRQQALSVSAEADEGRIPLRVLGRDRPLSSPR